jgi:hypothetical protein
VTWQFCSCPLYFARPIGHVTCTALGEASTGQHARHPDCAIFPCTYTFSHAHLLFRAGGTSINQWLPPAVLASLRGIPTTNRTPVKKNLFNTMIAPLLDAKFHGVIWYQG